MFKMKLELQSVSSSELIAKVAIAAFVEQANPALSELIDIKTALTEAITNCIFSAYPDEIGIIYITAILDGNVFTLIVRDRGVGISNVAQAMVPLYTTLAENHSGMGFTIMESFMDEIKVKSTPGKGTTVTMKKTIIGRSHR